MKLTLFLALSLPLCAQEAKSLRLSQATLMASTVLDVYSSRGLREVNPILGRGDFRMSNQGAKAIGITGALILAESLIVRKFPPSRKVFKYVNFGGSAAHGAAAVHNFRLR
jgi:hypothetical protein